MTSGVHAHQIGWAMLKVGAQAPDFTVTLGSGERFTLSEHRGRNVVLFFYPRAFTPGCAAEVGGFCDYHDDLTIHNAVVIGISTDGVDKVKRFGDAIGTPFGLGSDVAGDIRRLYDVQRRFGLGTSRVTYVIDSEGVIRDVFHNEIVMTSHVQNALRKLESL